MEVFTFDVYFRNIILKLSITIDSKKSIHCVACYGIIHATV